MCAPLLLGLLVAGAPVPQGVVYVPGRPDFSVSGVPPAEAENVLKELFPNGRGVWHAWTKIRVKPRSLPVIQRIRSLDACPAAGQRGPVNSVVPRVDAVSLRVGGERLYLVALDWCPGNGLGYENTSLILLQRPGSSSWRAEVDRHVVLEKVLPVRRLGRLEPLAFLLSGGGTNQGRTVERAELDAFEGDEALLTPRDFGQVYSDDCGVASPTGVDVQPIQIEIPLQMSSSGVIQKLETRMLPKLHRSCP